MSSKSIKIIKMGQQPCHRCGWDLATNDVHRIVAGKDGGKYEVDNCITLCPNCHRLAHLGAKKKYRL